MFSKIKILFEIEKQLKSDGFVGDLWTDGTNILVNGKPILENYFTFEKFEEIKNIMKPYYGLEPFVELCKIISFEIAVDLNLVEKFICDECGADWFWRRRGSNEICPPCFEDKRK